MRFVILFRNQLIKNFAYYRTGGEAENLYLPSTPEEVAIAMRQIFKDEAPYFLLGKGSNSLVTDEKWPHSVLSFQNLKQMKLNNPTTIYVEAGVENTELANFALEHELTGVAWMNALPGQLGGTVRMNARCYGGEISEVVKKVLVCKPEGVLHLYENPKDLFCGYKDTIFMRNKEIIVAVEIELQKGEKSSIYQKMHACESDRQGKGQFLFPSCGCVFKNDYSPEVSVSSGLLLEMSGLKGFIYQGAQVNPHHSNFVYNLNNASARSILELTILMREKVWEKFGVWLEYEMEILGKIPEDLKIKIFEKRSPSYQSIALQSAKVRFSQKSL